MNQISSVATCYGCPLFPIRLFEGLWPLIIVTGARKMNLCCLLSSDESFINEDFLPELRDTLIWEKISQYESSKIFTFKEYFFVFERFFLSRSLYFAHKIIFWVTCFDLSSLSNTDLRNRTYETILRSVHIVSCPLIYKTIYFHFPFCLTQSS